MIPSEYAPFADIIRIVHPEELPAGDYTMFGTGERAVLIRSLCDGRRGVRISSLLEHDDMAQTPAAIRHGLPVRPPSTASGNIIIGASHPAFFNNQLRHLLERQEHVRSIYFIDEEKWNRDLEPLGPANGRVLAFIEYSARYGTDSGQRLIEFLRTTGWRVRMIHAMDFKAAETVIYDGCIFANGQSPAGRAMHESLLKNSRTKPNFMEWGFFPQSAHAYLDRKGVNQECSLMSDDLRWVEDRHIRRIEEVRSEFLPGFVRKEPKYILVPLQMPLDSNVVNSSRFNHGMQEFIDFTIDHHRDKSLPMLFKAHPKDVNKAGYDYRGHACTDRPFTALLPEAALVHGISSTTLYEAALAGIPVIAEGTGLLNRHATQCQRLLAAMIDRQFKIDASDFSYHIATYTSLPR
jgi:hypothetical protein